jgi:hypothetical protein
MIAVVSTMRALPGPIPRKRTRPCGDLHRGGVTRRLRAPLAGLSAGLVALLLCPGVSYGGAAGGSDNTTTFTTELVPATATTGVAREYEFGPVFETEPSAGCQVTIAWGDGTSSPASLGEADEGARKVTATHTYSAAGEYEASQTAIPSEKCHLGTRTVSTITVGEFTLGTNTNYNATIFAVTVSDPAPAPTEELEEEPAPKEHTSTGASSTGPALTTLAATSPAATQASAPAPAQSAQAIEPPASLCGKSSLFDLLDVYPAHGSAHLLGYADPRLAGQTVTIVSIWNKHVAATATVASDGYFHTTAALPPPRLRHTNRARFQAQDGSYRSSALKLTRRMYLYTLAPTPQRKVKITGIVLPPLTKPSTAITVYRRDDCKQPGYARVKATVKLDKRTGHFTLLTEAPPAQATGAVYRLSTIVRESAGAASAHTFTLPRTLITQ